MNFVFTREELELIHNALGLEISLSGRDVDPRVISLQSTISQMIRDCNKDKKL